MPAYEPTDEKLRRNNDNAIGLGTKFVLFVVRHQANMTPCELPLLRQWQAKNVDSAPLPEALDSCSRCGVMIPDRVESDSKYELCYKCDLEVSGLVGGWASWNRNSLAS